MIELHSKDRRSPYSSLDPRPRSTPLPQTAVASLARLSALTHLSLEGCLAISDARFVHLCRGLPNLKQLNLHGARLRDAALAGLPFLARLEAADLRCEGLSYRALRSAVLACPAAPRVLLSERHLGLVRAHLGLERAGAVVPVSSLSCMSKQELKVCVPLCATVCLRVRESGVPPLPAPIIAGMTF